MPHTPVILPRRQRGVTLIDFMVGMTVGLLVALAAVGSLVMMRLSARAMIDSAALEQQASLVMLLMGQQIRMAGSVNAYSAGSNPDAGINGSAPNMIAPSGGGGKVSFDTRPAGIAMNGTIPIPIHGQDGVGKAADTLTVAYAIPNDGTPTSNCIGTTATPISPGGAPRIVNIFSVNATTHDLLCGSGNGTAQPIASNVMDMQIRYSSVDTNGNITWRTAAQIGPANPPSANWASISGLEMCLHFQGEATQAPQQRFVNCQGDTVTSSDGRVHHIIHQTFYLNNAS